MSKYLIILFFCFASISCSKKEITTLVVDKSLHVIDRTEIWDGCYRTAFIYDTYLVLIASCDDFFFHVYDKKSLEFIWKFGQKGRGPNEFNFPFPFRTNTTSNLNDSILDFYDLNLPRLYNISLSKTINTKELSEGIETNDQDVNLFACDMLNRLTGNKIAGHDINIDSSDGMFFIYDKESKKKKWIEYLPGFKMEGKYRWNAYYGELYSNSKTIVYAARYFDEVLFFDTNGKLLHEYYFSEIKKPMFSKQYIGIDYRSLLYTYNAYGTSEYCYIIRVARPAADIMKSRNYPVQLLAFSWEGNLVDVYNIESIPQSFCIDESTNTMYLIVEGAKPDGKVNIIRCRL